MLSNAAKFQGYNFKRFWVIKEKPTGNKITPPPRLQPGLSISSVNVAKSAGNRGFGQIHWRNP